MVKVVQMLQKLLVDKLDRHTHRHEETGLRKPDNKTLLSQLGTHLVNVKKTNDAS